jgi:hypothetical protein
MRELTVLFLDCANYCDKPVLRSPIGIEVKRSDGLRTAHRLPLSPERFDHTSILRRVNHPQRIVCGKVAQMFAVDRIDYRVDFVRFLLHD